MALTMSVDCPACGDTVECSVDLKLGASRPVEGGGLVFDVAVENITGHEAHAATHQ